MTDLIISLSTIPPRMHHIEPTLESLFDQNSKIAEIRLNIPKTYRRFEFSPSDMPKMPKGINVCYVEEDLGPATKVLPTVADFRGQDVEIIFCDDDHHYPQNWATSLLQGRSEKPDACIARVGYDLAARTKLWSSTTVNALQPRAQRHVRTWNYRAKRILSLGMMSKPGPVSSSGYADIFQGYGGVMLRPEMMPDTAFNYPEHLRAVDDPVLSGFVHSNNVPIWVQAKPAWRPKSCSSSKIEPLLNLSVANKSRVDLDAAAVQYCQEELGVYQGITSNDQRGSRKTTRNVDAF